MSADCCICDDIIRFQCELCINNQHVCVWLSIWRIFPTLSRSICTTKKIRIKTYRFSASACSVCVLYRRTCNINDRKCAKKTRAPASNDKYRWKTLGGVTFISQMARTDHKHGSVWFLSFDVEQNGFLFKTDRFWFGKNGALDVFVYLV